MPPMLSLEDHTHKEFLMASRLNFANWRLTDVDNYMRGNVPFTQSGITDPMVRLTNFSKMEDLIDPKADEALTSKTREKIDNQIKEGLRWLDSYEPNSNAKIGL